MIEKIEDIVKTQVEAIKNIKFDKITVWDGGAGSGNGSATANFMKDLIKSLPAMHDLVGQAGIELPRILGKVEDCVSADSTEIVLDGIIGKNANDQDVVICPHCEAKYKAKNENGKTKIAGFGDVDDKLEGQQIYCINVVKNLMFQIHKNI